MKAFLTIIACVGLVLTASCSGSQSNVKQQPMPEAKPEPTCQQQCDTAKDKCLAEVKGQPAGSGEAKEATPPAEVSKDEWAKAFAEKQEATKKCQADHQKCQEACR